ENQLAAGRLPRRDPVDIGVAGVAFVMVDVDQEAAPGDARTDLSQAVETGGVRGDNAVKFMARFGLLKKAVGIEEVVFFREPVLVPTQDLLAFPEQRQGEAELRADAIAVGADVTDDTERAALA